MVRPDRAVAIREIARYSSVNGCDTINNGDSAINLPTRILLSPESVG